jgi:hypothetical protein
MQSLETLTGQSDFYVVPYPDQKQPGLRFPADYSVRKITEAIMQYQLPIAVRGEGDATSSRVSEPEDGIRTSRQNPITRKTF